MTSVVLRGKLCVCCNDTPSREIAEFLVVGQVLELHLAGEVAVEVAPLVLQLDAALRHVHRREGRVVLGRDVPVVRQAELEAARAGLRVVRREDAAAPPVAERKGGPRRGEDRDVEEAQPRRAPPRPPRSRSRARAPSPPGASLPGRAGRSCRSRWSCGSGRARGIPGARRCRARCGRPAGGTPGSRTRRCRRACCSRGAGRRSGRSRAAGARRRRLRRGRARGCSAARRRRWRGRRGVISALPRAVTSRSLTPSMTSASTTVRSSSASALRGRRLRFARMLPLPRPALAPASRCGRAWSRRTFSLLEFSMIHADVRRDAAQAWLAGQLSCDLAPRPSPSPRLPRTPASAATCARRSPTAAASSRWTRRRSSEDCRPFVRVARHAARGRRERAAGAGAGPRAGLPAAHRPRHAHLPRGAERDSNAAPLFADATDALLRWQLASRPGELPPYDEALLRREMNLFPEWYVGRHLARTLSQAQKQAAGEDLRSCWCKARSRSRWSTCTATTCRAT